MRGGWGNKICLLKQKHSSMTVEIVTCNPNFDFVNNANGTGADVDQWSSSAPTYDLAKKACLDHFATTDQPQKVWMQYYSDHGFNCSLLKNPTSTDKPVKNTNNGMLCTTQLCSLDDHACLSKNMQLQWNIISQDKDIQKNKDMSIYKKLEEAVGISSVYTETSCSDTDATCMAKACEAKGLTFLSNNHFSNQGTTYALCGKTHITKTVQDNHCGADTNPECIQKECNEYGLSMSGFGSGYRGLCTPTGYDIMSTQFNKWNDGRHPPPPAQWVPGHCDENIFKLPSFGNHSRHPVIFGPSDSNCVPGHWDPGIAISMNK